MPDWDTIGAAIAAAGNQAGGSWRPVEGCRPEPVKGGDINAAWRLETDGGPLFVKTAGKSDAAMFEAEADGLSELGAADAVRVPGVVTTGVAADTAFIAMEWIEFGRGTRQAEAELGAGLAALHRKTSERYGWHRDNTIGRTPQPNPWSDDWVAFFREHRLGFQLGLAGERGHGGELQRLGAEVAEGLGELFDGYEPAPSLLHGDLWGGNWAVADGVPVIFDPAVYYGDRESDLAMTRLFGGFGGAFYEAYEAAWPTDPGAGVRNDLYQLYHLLNHLNLFGGGYAGSAVAAMQRLVRAIRQRRVRTSSGA